MKQLVRALLFIVIWVLVNGSAGSHRPALVNIGAIFTFDSVIGRAAKPALEAAVSDVNNDTRILKGTELRLIMKDARCNIFMGAIEAFEIVDKEVVAIIGPESSGIARIITEIANGLQVPLVSYAATDPTLSALQFPYFVRTTQTDSYQMAAMADLVQFFEWKEVIAVFVDDDYGRNGLVALENELNKKMIKVTSKLALNMHLDEREVMDTLNKSKSLGPRVYILHVYPDPEMRIFNIAEKLEMMSSNYVWLATDWFAETIGPFSPVNQTLPSFLQGVVGLRQHTPESKKKRDFVSRMQQRRLARSELNTYGLQAYDTVWALAYAIGRFIEEFNNITFSPSGKLLGDRTSQVFDSGAHLLEKILQLNFSGVAGQIRFKEEDRNIMSGGYDVININKRFMHSVVGYWSNSSGFSLIAPEYRKQEENGYSRLDQHLKGITWPGGTTERPLGWVIAVDEKPLRIGVPNRASFVEFVTEIHDSHKIQGYCIDVFVEALKLLPYDVPYRFEPFGDGRSNPKYDELVFDAAVGDIAIVTNRTKIVDFSQPFAATGLVIVAPISNTKSSAWVFLQPFTAEMWAVTGASFVIVAVVIWVLEHRVNDEFRGPPRRQIVTMFLFSFSTLFKTNQETTISALGRFVMVTWLFLLMVITASYTASLTSILTVQQLSSPITGIDSLITSNWPVGYQVGSFAYEYLTENLGISRSRLISLGSPEEYGRALRQGPGGGGVAAIIDELPYVELFLSKQRDFGIIGTAFTRGGWGFVSGWPPFTANLDAY
ncbi:hypothetical protein Tsubulata_046136 [Turnera subulata]|uniref:Glutamate receptor n=1 Tax=Turnera subulata TaxID=218843 RepID=A0A9Q0G8N0_9ROSI|nr:hypothetical protein Tsubulata_046136 [Turnera subulata]